MRIDRLLSNLGYGSRKEVERLLRQNKVSLDGALINKGELHVNLTPELRERILVESEPLDPLPGLTILLHKPTGFTCSHKEEGDLVYDLFPDRWQKREPPLSTVGRLDKDTSGLLLLSDNGALVHKITSPKNHVPKRYRATLARPLNGKEAEIFASGKLMLEGEEKPLLPAILKLISPTKAEVTISEGRYHQVRRMFAAVGNHVLTLHREQIGGLKLPNTLSAGEYLAISEAEVQSIFATAQP